MLLTGFEKNVEIFHHWVTCGSYSLLIGKMALQEWGTEAEKCLSFQGILNWFPLAMPFQEVTIYFFSCTLLPISTESDSNKKYSMQTSEQQPQFGMGILTSVERNGGNFCVDTEDRREITSHRKVHFRNCGWFYNDSLWDWR